MQGLLKNKIGSPLRPDYLKRFFDLLKASLADSFTVEENDVVCIVTENAGGLILLKNYLIFIGKYLDRILLLDIKAVNVVTVK